MNFPAFATTVVRLDKSLRGLRGGHVLAGARHSVQRERAAEVNALLIEFLCGL